MATIQHFDIQLSEPYTYVTAGPTTHQSMRNVSLDIITTTAQRAIELALERHPGGVIHVVQKRGVTNLLFDPVIIKELVENHADQKLPTTVDAMTDNQPTPSPEDVAKWEAAVEATRAEHPDWDDAKIAGAIAYAVMTPEVVAEVAEIAAQHNLDVALWTSVIADMMARFGPGTEANWTEQECNDNLINLLRATPQVLISE
jgi:hypothetical protein